MSELPNENDRRFIAVLNKKMDMGRTLNVLGHISVGLSNLVSSDGPVYVDYKDKEGHLHPNLSHFPFIVLKADNSNKIRRLREESLKRGIQFVDFTSTMIDGGSLVQQAATSNTLESDLEYLGLCLFGNTEELRAFTKKYSLYK